MQGVIISLFSSRKFVIALVAILALVPLVVLKTMSIEQFTELYKWVVVTIIGGIALEGAAEKVLLPPPANARAADSLKPPPINTPATPLPPVLGVLVLALVLTSCTQKRALTAAESAQYDIELKGCYDNAKSWAEYNSCANDVDKKHGVKP